MAKAPTATSCDICGIQTKPGGGPAPDANCHVQLGGIDKDCCLACLHATLAMHCSPSWAARRAQSVEVIAEVVARGLDPLHELTAPAADRTPLTASEPAQA